MSKFAGKVAIITGGSLGIGRATAIAFAQQGAKVVVADYSEGEQTVRLVQEIGGDGLFIRTDVSKEADVQAMVEKTVEAYGRLDYAFNNAGIAQEMSSLVEQTEEQFDRIINVNVKGVWLCMKFQIPLMLKNGGGAIVNNSSGAGVVGIFGMPIYSASKHAVLGLTKSVALEYAKSGIRINAVCPGIIETDMFARYGSGDMALEVMPIGRIGKPSEIANIATWLCSEEASFVTGHALIADGGYTVQ
jgi:NAD(P)-dependent dehydrogenase (short-subunit alcohol dehydrogenase family)